MLSDYKVAIIHRSYETNPNVSHAGLGVCAINTCKTLNQYGIWATVWGLGNAQMLDQKLSANPHITHVVIQAPWIPTDLLRGLSVKYHDVQFAVNCHSNVGFLQTEPSAVTLMIELLSLEQTTSNVHCAGNSEEFTNWMSYSYQAECTLLPNLYYLDRFSETHRPSFSGGTLKVGIFGAPRPQKNIMTGACGIIQMAQMMKQPTEIWVNAGRNETHGKTILEAVKRAIAQNPYCTYKEFPWAPWPEFRRFVGSMSLLVQASYSESFNQVVADGVATGVPSVISSAIRWAPKYWQADTDSADSVSQVGRMLIGNPLAGRDGVEHLREHNDWGVQQWITYLKGYNFKIHRSFHA